MSIVVINSTQADRSYGFYYLWKNLLLLAGWTVSRSSDGVSQYGAADYIDSPSDLNHQYSWLVMRSPDGAREHMVRWYTTNATYTNWYYSRSASFIGGDLSSYPSATDIARCTDNQVINNGTDSHRFIGAAETTSPYGWWAYAFDSAVNMSNGEGGMAEVPLTASIQPGEVDPYVFFSSTGGFGTGMQEEYTSSGGDHAAGWCPGPAPAWGYTMPALAFRTGGGLLIPSNVPADVNSKDLSFPIMFGRQSGLPTPNGFKGTTTWAQWNGVSRSVGATFNSLTRISVGNMNMPWDGSTIPIG